MTKIKIRYVYMDQKFVNHEKKLIFYILSRYFCHFDPFMYGFSSFKSMVYFLLTSQTYGLSPIFAYEY